MKNHKLLASAIIERAIEDYIDCLLDWNLDAMVNRHECERFFRSEWFSTLCDLNGEETMELCKALAEKIENLQFDIKKMTEGGWAVFRIDCPDAAVSIHPKKSEAIADAMKHQGIPIRHYAKSRRIYAMRERT